MMTVNWYTSTYLSSRCGVRSVYYTSRVEGRSGASRRVYHLAMLLSGELVYDPVCTGGDQVVDVTLTAENAAPGVVYVEFPVSAAATYAVHAK